MTITLTELRLRADLSVISLGKKAGVSPSTVSRIERGLTSPSLLTARRISKALGVDVSEIEFGGRR